MSEKKITSNMSASEARDIAVATAYKTLVEAMDSAALWHDRISAAAVVLDRRPPTASDGPAAFQRAK